MLTTASDSRETIGVDILGRELGCDLGSPPTTNSSAAAPPSSNDEPVALVQEAGSKDWWTNHANGRKGPKPANVSEFSGLEDIDPDRLTPPCYG